MRDHTRPAGLTLRPGGIWWIDKTVRAGGRSVQLRESTGCREIEGAIDRLAERIAETEADLQHAEDRRLGQGEERTFGEAAAQYILGLERRGKSTKRPMVDLRMVDAAIGHLPCSHVHQIALQDWIDAQKGQRSSGTVGRALATVSTVLTYAARVLRDGNRPWLLTAPPKFEAPDWGQRQPYRLSWEEQDRLVAALPAHLIAPVLFALATGGRDQEIVTLRWDRHVPVDGIPTWGVWWIPPEIRKANARLGSSQQQGRYLVANAMARSVIAGQRQQTPWVFPSIRVLDSHPCRMNNHAWTKACRAAGLPIRVHDLRHTFGERAANAGIPFDVRKTLLGHHHSDITAHYSTPGLSRLIEESERIVRPGVRLEPAPRRAAR